MYRNNWILVIALLMTLGLGAAVAAQQANPATPDQLVDVPAQIQIEVPAQGIGFDEQGHLLVLAVMTNVGTQRSAPMDLIAVVLNDCILSDIPQTCRFVAFGSFHQVTPEGIAPGESVQWTFDFGPYPEVELGRWSIIWYQVQ